MDKLRDNQAPSHGRGRPSRVRAEEIGSAILQAGRTCFLERGFVGTTMELVAEQAGITKATLYARYRDKRALLKGVLKDRMRVWGEVSARTDWMMGETIEERLSYLACIILNRSRNSEIRAFRHVVDGLWGEDQSLQAELRHFVASRIHKMLREEIQRHARQNGLALTCADDAASMFLGMLSGYHFDESRSADDAEDIATYCDQAVAIFTAGMAKW